MFKINFVRKCLYVVYLFIIFNLANASILDYIPLGKSLFGTNNDKENSNELTIQNVPYEIEVTDEKFIEQAAKFTGVSLSELDKCQHRVIFKLQSECHKLNDEELAKLAVKLLNCQSAIEGRTLYPCTDEMAIRDCTSNMDPDTWNSYLLMSNRARAVCYSIRQAQFRGLTEMTVNKLMGTAHEQLQVLGRVSAGQARVEAATSVAFEKVASDTAVLRQQQSDLRQAQLHGQLQLEDNIRRLADEKQLIIEGHEQLAEMTRQVQEKLDEAAKQLDNQAEERRDNHKEILKDLIEIQTQAQAIFARIEESSRHLLTTSAAATAQYEATLSHLAEVNATVAALGGHVQWLGAALERQLQWLTTTLGGADDTLDRLYLVTSHAAVMVLGMVACAFLQVAPAGRVALVTLVPANLALAIQQGQQGALTMPGVTFAVISFIVAQAFLNFALHLYHRRNNKPSSLPAPPTHHTIASPTSAIQSSPPTPTQSPTPPPTFEHDTTYDSTTAHNSTFSDSFSYHRGVNGTSVASKYNTSTYRRLFDLDNTDSVSTSGDFGDFASPTPPLSRQGRSRSKTPAVNGVERHKCSATTRMGTPCKSSALVGRDFCYRHQTGSSVVMH